MLNGAEKTWAGAGIGERSHLERFAVSPARAGRNYFARLIWAMVGGWTLLRRFWRFPTTRS
jgi:hypothetical protein